MDKSVVQLNSYSKNIAAIDLGSNSFRLLIKKISDSGKIESDDIISESLQPVRLGEGLPEKGYLSKQAMHRGLTACRIFAGLLDKYTPIATRVCGTEALRTAANSHDFILPAQEVLGTPIEVLTAAEEAKLTIRGCLAGFDNHIDTPIILVDSGGCSTEISLIRNGQAPIIQSLPIGALNITENFSGTTTVCDSNNTSLAKPGRYLTELIRPAIKRLLEGQNGQQVKLLAAGGTATAMAMLDLNLQNFRASIIQGHKITLAGIQKMIAEVSQLPLQKRYRLPALGNRGGIFLAGVMIFQEIMQSLNTNIIGISTAGLLDGILSQMTTP